MATNATAPGASDVKDLALADVGKRRIEWAFQSMPVLQSVRKQFIKAQPLEGIRIAACLHVTAETANLMIALRDGGASLALCASNPLSTQDDVAAALVRDYNIPVYAIRGDSAAAYRSHIAAVLESSPQVTMDDGADLAVTVHTTQSSRLEGVRCGTEQTSTGMARLRSMARQGVLKYPVVAVNSRYGAGQSTIDGIVRAANVLLAGLNVVVAGFGSVGRAISTRARGMGANVVVTEIDPGKAIEAVMDGFRVMSMPEAAQIADVIVTAAGNKNVLARDHFDKLKNGVILANAGHSNVEIDVEALARTASSRRPARDLIDEYVLRDGRRVYLIAEGRLVNLAAAEGHPASVMDMSFAAQALSLEYVLKHYATLDKQVHAVPEDIDRGVARMKLEAMGVKLDRVTQEQEAYVAGWQEGR